MKQTVEMIKNTSLWAGLNKPEILMEDADIVIFGIPYDGGVSFRAGAKDAPRAIREITYTIAPTTERFESISDLKILDLGDATGNNRKQLFEHAENMAYKATKAGKLFTMIGGDHSTTIPVLRGVDQAVDEPFGIIHLDAHFDLCAELEGDILSHGCTERRALELNNITDTESIFFLGVRSIESQELDFINKNKVNLLSAKDVRDMGVTETIAQVKHQMKRFNKIYLTIDIDCLDPAYAGGTGTPQFGGFDGRELLNLLYGLFDLPIIGFDVVEVAPSLDPALASVFAARKIITECWGHHHRKRTIITG